MRSWCGWAPPSARQRPRAFPGRGRGNARRQASPKGQEPLHPDRTAVRLLLFTGCRLREILHLKWEQVDLERGLLFLADSKTGRKTVILNAPALAVLAGLDRLGSYVVPGGRSRKAPRGSLASMGGTGEARWA